MGCSASQLSPAVCDKEVVAQDFHDKYMLGVKIGRGAFAQVRSCSKIVTGPVRPTEEEKQPDRAVKILHMKSKEGEVCQQLQKAAHTEATCWSAIGIHPNCVRLHDLFFGNDFCYMVMEKCASGLLQALEAMPELTERGLGNIFAQMLLGISHCHSVKVVHRDIKPDNFLVGGDDGGTVKLADFGLSAIIPKQGKLPGVFGTAPFMCPEMLVGRWYDEKADVWSFAVTVYVLLYGQFPYMPKQQSSKAMKQAIIDGVPAPSYEPVQKAGANRSASFRSPDAVDLCKKLLSREPEKRPLAEETLHMPWMSAAMQGCHMNGSDLPSLRPMLHASKKVGAFEVRDPARDTQVDVTLNTLQVQKHGKPLPVTPSQAHGDRRRLEAGNASSAKTGSKSAPKLGVGGSGRADSENGSNRSTTCDSSNNSNNGSHSDPNTHLHGGSGWSKGTSTASIGIVM